MQTPAGMFGKKRHERQAFFPPSCRSILIKEQSETENQRSTPSPIQPHPIIWVGGPVHVRTLSSTLHFRRL